MTSLTERIRHIDLNISELPDYRVVGRVEEISGVIIVARLHQVRIGELCRIEMKHQCLYAEVVAFRNERCLLMPYGSVHGIRPDTRVIPTGRLLHVKCGGHLLGSVLDGLGNILKKSTISNSPDHSFECLDVDRSAPDPLLRNHVKEILETGIPAVDSFLTVGKGQRIGIFASAGTGKSTLIGEIAKSSRADVIIINLIGERGREVREFIEENLGSRGLERSVVVVATSDQPAIVRLKSAYVATTIAEHFRDLGQDVCLIMDSVTRFARSLRELGLARGEPPARAGFPPSVYAELPRLLERSGNDQNGSITGFYTVLTETEELNDPVSDEVMSILDGHIILSRKLAHQNHYPAIDVLKSKSRIMSRIVTEEHRMVVAWMLDRMALYQSNEDAIRFGFHEPGKNLELDVAIRVKASMDKFLFSGNCRGYSLNELIRIMKEIKSDAEQV